MYPHARSSFPWSPWQRYIDYDQMEISRFHDHKSEKLTVSKYRGSCQSKSLSTCQYIWVIWFLSFAVVAQSIRAVEYTDCISTECPGYDTKQSDGKAPVMLELWEMQSTTSLPSLPDLLWPGVVASDRFLSMGEIEVFNVKLSASK